MPEMFNYRFQVLESHLDTFGHVNNATYLQLFEEARWDFITKRGYGLEEIQKTQIGPVILELELKFKRELLNREWIQVQSIAQEQNHPLVGVLHQEMIKENGKVGAILDLKVGLMDLKERKLIKPNEKWLYSIGLH